jgi:hypothetical protein
MVVALPALLQEMITVIDRVREVTRIIEVLKAKQRLDSIDG